MNHMIKKELESSAATISQIDAGQVMSIARSLVAVFRSGGKVVIFGNGGSAADAQHLAAEFSGRYLIERPPLRAIALTNISAITSRVRCRPAAVLTGALGEVGGLACDDLLNRDTGARLMSATRILWGQIIVVFLIALAAVWCATQWTAAALAYGLDKKKGGEQNVVIFDCGGTLVNYN